MLARSSCGIGNLILEIHVLMALQALASVSYSAMSEGGWVEELKFLGPISVGVVFPYSYVLKHSVEKFHLHETHFIT